MIKKNIVQLLLRESPFRNRLIVLFLLIVLAAFQVFSIKATAKEISVLKEENEWQLKLASAPKQKKEVKKAAPKPEIPRKEYNLEGMTEKDGMFHALINGDIYKQGDEIDQYTVNNITTYSATLVSETHNETRMIYFNDIIDELSLNDT